MRVSLLSCFLLFLLVSLAAAEETARAQTFSGRIVTSVQYEPPEQPLAQEDLNAMQLVRVGQPLDLNQVATTIDNLWGSGAYDNIEVDAEPSGNGVAIRFITTARWFVGHVGAEG